MTEIECKANKETYSPLETCGEGGKASTPHHVFEE